MLQQCTGALELFFASEACLWKHTSHFFSPFLHIIFLIYQLESFLCLFNVLCMPKWPPDTLSWSSLNTCSWWLWVVLTLSTMSLVCFESWWIMGYLIILSVCFLSKTHFRSGSFSQSLRTSTFCHELLVMVVCSTEAALPSTPEQCLQYSGHCLCDMASAFQLLTPNLGSAINWYSWNHSIYIAMWPSEPFTTGGKLTPHDDETFHTVIYGIILFTHFTMTNMSLLVTQ